MILSFLYVLYFNYNYIFSSNTVNETNIFSNEQRSPLLIWATQRDLGAYVNENCYITLKFFENCAPV